MTQPYALADVERIVTLARRLPVFPCGPDKKPRIARGFHAASQDEAQIRAWWRQWPDALVGVPTGQTTGLVVVDYDAPKANQATNQWMLDHTELLTGTRVHVTPRGGRHYVFRSTERYMTGVDIVLGGSPRRGIDLRANGGYVIWWPMHLAGSSDGETPTPLPAGLIDERRFDATRDMAPLPTATPASWAADRPRAFEALRFLTPDGYDNWIRAGMAVHAASGGSDDGFALWHDWSASGDSYDGIEDCRYHWASFGRYQGRGLGLGSLIATAKAAGMVSQPPPEPRQSSQEATEEPTPATARAPLNWFTLSQSEPPERQWAIPHWLGIGYMTLLAGAGGVGKTLLAQQLGSGLATGESLLEAPARPLRVLMWAGEDDHDELWRRQWQIARSQRRLLSDYQNFIVESFAGKDCSLVEPVFGHLTPTAHMEELKAQVADYTADVVILDNVARLYGGDENSRHQVTQFVNWVSGACNAHHPTAVLLLAHPSKAQGSEYAGSTAWEAAVRSRWFFGRTLPDDENPPQDENVRYLSRRKSNYSSLDCIKMDFDPVTNTLRRAEEEPQDNRRAIHPARAEKMIIDAINELSKQNVFTSDGVRQSNYIVREMVHRNMAPKSHTRYLEDALFRLMKMGTVRRDVVGRYSNRAPREGLIVAGDTP